MKGRLALLVGAGIGYVFGTRAGRQQFDKMKGWANQTWNDPRVQSKVGTASQTATQFAKDQSSALKGKVRSTGSRGGSDTGATWESAGAAGTTGTTGTTGMADASPIDPVEPLPGTTPTVNGDDRPTTL